MSDARRSAPSAELPSLPVSPRRLPSAGALVVPRHLPSTPPPARRGTSCKHRPSIPSVRQDGRTATPSLTPVGSSPRAAMEAQAVLIAANELLRYRPIDDVYEEWLDRVAELVRAAGGAPAPSFLLHLTPPRTGDEAPGAPPHCAAPRPSIPDHVSTWPPPHPRFRRSFGRRLEEIWPWLS